MMRLAPLLALLAVAACGGDAVVAADAMATPDAAGPGWSPAPPLPRPISNNAVAVVDGTIYSALGIGAGLDAAAIVSTATALAPGADSWTALPDVPGTGRIAASAVALGGKLYVLGGYSVAAGGAETSHAEVDVYDPATGVWSAAAPLPVAIDDAVAVAWRDRWIVVVSGWSATRPVADVQIYDHDRDQWSAATDFPGDPVFGHAGALVGDELIVVDGVASRPVTGFALVSQAWQGTLDPDDPATITWRELAPHPGPARYRAAAGARDGVVFVSGGTADPYNFDGLSYDSGSPSAPDAATLRVDPATGAWTTSDADKPSATMDHRGFAATSDRLVTVGGMLAGPLVTDEVWALRP